VKYIGKPDAGLWELRDGWREHSFSNLLCWAGIDRSISIANQGFLAKLEVDMRGERSRAEAAVRRASFNGAVGNGPDDSTADASLLFLPLLRFPDAKLCRETTLQIERELTLVLEGKKHEGYLYRYLRQDDFGRPQSAFLICSYWLVQALVRIGEKERARAMMEKLSFSANSLGLLAEHFEPASLTQLGNFPQAYSHVGQILAAFAVSRPWDEVL
jgi:GH15 family glucan-1,4-alpha-glucosidase